MKKMYIFTFAFLAANFGVAQDSGNTLTFESFNIGSNSFYNGSDNAGQIPFSAITLSNSYNNTWSSWYGFSISNVTDNTTPGLNNQYASFPGAGSNSDNYAVFYAFGDISFSQPFQIKSLDVANTTYAGISMRDGDFYAKRFGSFTNADGDIDGTNGEDYFILHIIPKDANDNLVGDTIDFYLADFRFADSTEDYILDTWATIDLANEFIVANKLEFTFTSSDNSSFGSNTPTYFALDNLVVEALAGIKKNEIAFDIYPNPFDNQLMFKSDFGGMLLITNQLGQVVFEQMITPNQSVDANALSSGIYFATLTTDKGKASSKIVKN